MTLPNDDPALVSVSVDESPACAAASRQGQGGGPKTPFGKESSCKNATTHGLTGRALKNLPDRIHDRVNTRMTAYVPYYQPQTDEDMELCRLAALGHAQHETAQEEQYRFLKNRSERAQSSWEFDRAAEAGRLGERLSKRPAVVAAELSATLHGALWLIGRWDSLENALNALGRWDDGQVATAYDLMGRDAEARQFDPDKLAQGNPDNLRALVARHRDKLRKLVDGPHRDRDEELRRQAIDGEGFLNDPDYRRLVRYGDRALKLNQDCRKELERRREAREIDAFAPDGSIVTPPPLPGEPDRPDPDPDYTPIFHQPSEAPGPEVVEADEPASEPEPEPANGPVITGRPEDRPSSRKERLERFREEVTARMREDARLKAERRAAGMMQDGKPDAQAR